MVRYFKTTGIYDNSDLLKVEVEYDKGRGYQARITPCSKGNGFIGVSYCPEYYKYYNTLVCMLIPCGRKSAKKEAEACALAEKEMDWLLKQYVTMAENKGGRHIEIVGELED
jgi:hypothetical protein